MNSFWRSLTTTVWQYGNTTLITHDNYLRLTLFIKDLVEKIKTESKEIKGP